MLSNLNLLSLYLEIFDCLRVKEKVKSSLPFLSKEVYRIYSEDGDRFQRLKHPLLTQI